MSPGEINPQNTSSDVQDSDVPQSEPGASLMTRPKQPRLKRGNDLLRDPLLNKGSAFTKDERRVFELDGLLPATFNTQDQQADRFYATFAGINDSLDRYRELSSLQDRNESLFYRVLQDHIEEMMPIVYTPTVGLATQKFSDVFQRGRGIWVNPSHKGRVREVLDQATAGRDIRLLVVTDNESVLGIGDQGAGGMAISIGKLALYTACAGISPATTLPVSLDVGTNNETLRSNPRYLGWPEARLSGSEYDELIEEFVQAVTSLFPGALLQWEDFRKDNALTILDRYHGSLPSFNDDIQGTGAVTLAGLMSALRAIERPLSEQRILIHGAGAAGLGIARQIRAANPDADENFIALLDSKGLLVLDEPYRDAYKNDLAWQPKTAAAIGLSDPMHRSLEDVVRAYKPTVLIGTSGIPGSFSQQIIETMLMHADRPIVMPLSNPTSQAEATPSDVLHWTDGQALVATGSPFPAVKIGDRTIHIGQGNNVFIFPALGMGTLISHARSVTDNMITACANELALSVTNEELESGLLYPAIERLSEVTRRLTIRVARQAIEDGVAGINQTDVEAMLENELWSPAYPSLL